jgi:hypothetical protein
VVYSYIQWNSRNFLACRTELNMASRDPNFFNISMFFQVRFDRTELCFIAFESFYMMYLIHLNDFYELRLFVRFDRTELEKTSKYWKKSIRFGSIFQESSRVSLYTRKNIWDLNYEYMYWKIIFNTNYNNFFIVCF